MTQDSHTAILRQRAEYEYEFYKQHGRPPRPFYMKCLRCEEAWEQDGTLVNADYQARYHAGYHGGYREEHAEIVVTDSTGRELFRHHAIHTEGKKESGCPACGAHSYGDGVSCPECGHIPEVHRMYPEDPEEQLVTDGGTETERVEVGNLTFSKSAAEDVIQAFGWELTSEGYLWDDDAVFSIMGQPVHIEDLAGIVEYEGEPRPLRDDFTELVEYVKYKHHGATETESRQRKERGELTPQEAAFDHLRITEEDNR